MLPVSTARPPMVALALVRKNEVDRQRLSIINQSDLIIDTASALLFAWIGHSGRSICRPIWRMPDGRLRLSFHWEDYT